MVLNSIGLDTKKTKVIADNLNHLLANFQTYYQNLRGIHWNIKGRAFLIFMLSLKNFIMMQMMKVDEIAERILTLGEIPLHTFKDYYV